MMPLDPKIALWLGFSALATVILALMMESRRAKLGRMLQDYVEKRQQWVRKRAKATRLSQQLARSKAAGEEAAKLAGEQADKLAGEQADMLAMERAAAEGHEAASMSRSLASTVERDRSGKLASPAGDLSSARRGAKAA